MRAIYVYWTLLLLLLGGQHAAAHIGLDGLCDLFIFVPFTNFGFDNLAFESDLGLTNNGFSQMATAVLAARHFNERNSTVAIQLEDYHDCPITFDIEGSTVFNTDGYSHKSSESFFDSGQIPCAMIGPANDLAATELGVFANAGQIPLVTTRTFNTIIGDDFHNPFTSNIFPDVLLSSEQVAKYLLHKNRTDFIGLVYPISDVGLQRREILSVIFDESGIRWTSSGFASAGGGSVLLDNSGTEIIQRSYFTAMQRIRDSGYKTVVIAMEFPYVDLKPIADAAAELGMLGGDYFYVFQDIFEPFQIFEEDPNIRKLIEGAAWIFPLTEDLIFEDDPFFNSWADQGEETVRLINELNPIQPGMVGYVDADENFFLDTFPEYGSGFVYDAVMAAGIGACDAYYQYASENNGEITGSQHLEGIRNVFFWGTSGDVEFELGERGRDGARRPGTSNWVSLNFLPPNPDNPLLDYFHAPDIVIPAYESEDWVSDQLPFVFADGTTSPPKLLRETPDQNYLSDALRVFGFTAMCFSIFLAICLFVWVIICRKHRVLLASQPPFLGLICVGTIIQSTAVIPISFDESEGWTNDQLSNACQSIPWLMCCGYVLVYSALFSKLWRVNRVLQATRMRIKIENVVGPMIVFFLLAIAMLILWTTIDPMAWERREVDSKTGESIGRCESEHPIAYIIPLVFILLLPTCLTAWFAYKTKDVDEAYTESWWIFVMVLVQVEVVIIAAPVVIILREESTDGRYLGLVFLFLSFPLSTLAFIMFPKVLTYRRAVLGIEEKTSKRGESKGIRVSGVPSAGHSSNVNNNSNSSSINNYSSTPMQKYSSNVSDLPPVNEQSELENDSESSEKEKFSEEQTRDLNGQPHAADVSKKSDNSVEAAETLSTKEKENGESNSDKASQGLLPTESKVEDTEGTGIVLLENDKKSVPDEKEEVISPVQIDEEKPKKDGHL